MSEERPTTKTPDGLECFSLDGVGLVVLAYEHNRLVSELKGVSAHQSERIAELEADLGETAAMRDAACAICSDVRAENAKLRDDLKDAVDALEMVRDADDDSIKDGLTRWCTSVARCRIDKVIAKFYGKEPS